jgi:hypothetical protein
MKTELDKALVLFIAENNHCSVIVAMNQRTKLTLWRKILKKKKKSKEQLSWSRNSLNLMEPKVHYRVQKNPSAVPIMSQINAVHILISCFSNIYFNKMILSVPLWLIIVELFSAVNTHSFF